MHKRNWWLAVVVVAAGLHPVAAQSADWRKVQLDGWQFSVPVSSQCTREPSTPYSVELVSAAETGLWCGGRLACTLNNRMILVQQGMSRDMQSMVIAHEKAHINGCHHPE